MLLATTAFLSFLATASATRRLMDGGMMMRKQYRYVSSVSLIQVGEDLHIAIIQVALRSLSHFCLSRLSRKVVLKELVREKEDRLQAEEKNLRTTDSARPTFRSWDKIARSACSYVRGSLTPSQRIYAGSPKVQRM